MVSEDNLKITNLYIEIPSEWARGKKEMVMVSAIGEMDDRSDFYLDLLRQFAKTIVKSESIYKSFYVDSRDKEDQEVPIKYDELKTIFLDYLKNFEEKKKEIEIMELMATKDLSLSGAHRLFGDIMIDVISCLLQNKKTILYGDKDASVALFKVLNRIFLDIVSVDEKILIQDKVDDKTDAFVINTSLRLIEQGEVSDEANNSINKFLQEAEKTGDNEAGIIFVRQKFAILFKIADLLEKTVKKKQPAKSIIKNVNKHLRIKISVDELYAVRHILQGRGKENIAEMISLSKMDKF